MSMSCWPRGTDGRERHDKPRELRGPGGLDWRWASKAWLHPGDVGLEQGRAPGSKPISLQACPTMETCQQGSGPTHRCETITAQAVSCWRGVCVEGQDGAGALGLRDGSRRQRRQLLGSCPPRAGLPPGCQEAAGQGTEVATVGCHGDPALQLPPLTRGHRGCRLLKHVTRVSDTVGCQAMSERTQTPGSATAGMKITPRMLTADDTHWDRTTYHVSEEHSSNPIR